jgi:hypothetical protein
LEVATAVIIGEDVTKSYLEHLPDGTAVSKQERIVRLPLNVLIEALTLLALTHHSSTEQCREGDDGTAGNPQS